MSSRLINPADIDVTNENQMVAMLASFYDALADLTQSPQLPDMIPSLKAITVSFFSDMRKNPGDVKGTKGPRACIVTGTTAAMDGGQGVFAWDPNSLAVDDNVSNIQANGVTIGRWRRVV